MRYFSTFSGIGGFELGIERACISKKERGTVLMPECVGYSEIDSECDKCKREGRDKNQPKTLISKTRVKCDTCGAEKEHPALQIYEKHFNHKNYGDITKIDAKGLPDFDILVGGFPCQAFSIAGQRKGFDDTRGTLFFDVARIIREKQPRLLLLENVKGLLSHDKGRTFYTIITTLDELGYDIQWQVLNSKNHGVPQNRERVFIIGHLRGTSRPKVLPLEGSDEENKSRDRESIKGDKQPFIAAQRGRYNKEGKTEQQLEPRKDNLTNTLTSVEKDNYVCIQEATKKGYAVAAEGDSINLSVPNSKTRRGRVGKGIAQTIDTGMQQHTLQGAKIRRLTPTECERLQGFPDGWTISGVDLDNKEISVSDTQRYKTLGNAVTVNVVADIIKKL